MVYHIYSNLWCFFIEISSVRLIKDILSKIPEPTLK